MEQFLTLAHALIRYRELSATGVKVLGLTDGVQALELVKCLPLSPRGREGESVLAAGLQMESFWAQVPEVGRAVERCVADLGIRYAVDGNIIVPVPSPKGLPEALQDKYLWLNIAGDTRSAIHRVYVSGRGWGPLSILDRQLIPMPLVLKYQADGINEDGTYFPLEVEPWEYELLLQRTRERLEEKRRNER